MYIIFFLCVNKHLLNGFIDFDEFFYVCLSESLNGLDLQLDPVGPTRGGTQTEILIFTMEIFIYK